MRTSVRAGSASCLILPLLFASVPALGAGESVPDSRPGRKIEPAALKDSASKPFAG